MSGYVLLIVMSILAGAVALVVLLVACHLHDWVDGGSDGRRVEPGPWFPNYHTAWSAAHPGAWERGEEQSGGFFKGDVWGSSTLEWDQQWFARNGMKMPRQVKHVEPRPPGPNEFRIGTLGPGESVSIPIRLDDEQSR